MLNINFSLEKDFGELNEKKLNRLIDASADLNLIQMQQIDDHSYVFAFEQGGIILKSDTKEIICALRSSSDLSIMFERFTQFFEVLDLDLYGNLNFNIQGQEEYSTSIALASQHLLNIEDDTLGIGLRLLKDTSTEFPKEFRIEPKIDDFNSLFLLALQNSTKAIDISETIVENDLSNLIDTLNKYKKIYLEKGGIFA